MCLLEETHKNRAHGASTRMPRVPQAPSLPPSRQHLRAVQRSPEAARRCTLGAVVLRAAARPRPAASRLGAERGTLGAVVRPPPAASVRRGRAGGEGGELASGRLRPGGVGP